MRVVLAWLVGAGTGWLVLRTTRSIRADPRLMRENYRGTRLPTAAGLALVLAMLLIEGGRALLEALGIGERGEVRPAMLLGVLAFGLLGLVDDLLGDSAQRGLRGHIEAVRRGRVTTGLVKLGAGAAVSIVLAGWIDGSAAGRVLVDGALISLAANLGNLLDRAPGRTLKWSLAAYVPLGLVAGSSPAGIALAVVMGAGVALLAGDLRERFMLGDTGANALGAALGIAAVAVTGPAVRNILAAVLLALTLTSEKTSFSRIIEAVAPLRWFDRVGRLPGGPGA